jgi:DegV family protein with EDD domain
MKILLDDAADMPAELVQKYGVATISVNVHFGTDEFRTNVDITPDEFYAKVANINNSNWPKTSQPTPFQYEERFRELIADGHTDIIAVTVGEKLSGTYASAIAAQKEIGDAANISVFNSQSASAAMGLMGLEAAKMAQNGASRDAILARLTDMRDKQVVALVINSLEWAVKGGRVSGLRGFMASLLNIKPIMQLKDGEVVEAGKVRTHKKALKFMADFVKEQVGDRKVNVALLHANEPEGVAQVRALAVPMLNTADVSEVDLCLPVAINLGPGTLGLIAMPAYDD